MTQPSPQSEPTDSRIMQMRSALDDARTLAADLLDDIPASEWPTRHYLRQVSFFSNVALRNAQKLR